MNIFRHTAEILGAELKILCAHVQLQRLGAPILNEYLTFQKERLGLHVAIMGSIIQRQIKQTKTN